MKGRWMMKDIRNIALLLVIFTGVSIMYESDWYNQADQNIVLYFEQYRSPMVTEYFIFFTEFGSGRTLFPLLLVAAILLSFKRRAMEALFLFCCFFGSRLFNWLLKNGFERERPSFNPLTDENSYSFPSGHAMNSAAFFSFTGYLLIRYFPGCRFPIAGAMGLIIASIALSRVYLGVHFVTDITAGICAGLIWSILIKIGYKRTAVKFRQN
ncbi:phosphatase PAP2 family protein [Metabacillus sp. 113a]|uniref:phosphatase PAP2 family protein n=1 Tax=Metabacillus sp. 113a TaxID=3404706 RepID=UPI003CF776A1